MIKTLNFNDFWESSIIRESFSYGSAEALFEYLEECEVGIDEPIEFDPIAIRCDYSEYTKEELYNDFKSIFEENEISISDDIDDIVDIFNQYTTTILVDDETLIVGSF